MSKKTQLEKIEITIKRVDRGKWTWSIKIIQENGERFSYGCGKGTHSECIIQAASASTHMA